MGKKKTTGMIVSLFVMILLLAILFFASINIGSLKVGVSDILKGMIGKSSEEASTVLDLRLPRIFISMLAGAATAVSGVLFQAVLKNPLADPGIIGISSGASFTAIWSQHLLRHCFSLRRYLRFLEECWHFVLCIVCRGKGDLVLCVSY